MQYVVHTLEQLFAVTLVGLRSIPERRGGSLVIVIGMACVVAVTISILSMSTGFVRMVNRNGRPDRVIILSQNSLSEFASSLSRESVLTIGTAPGVRRTDAGKAIVSAESLAHLAATKKSNGLDAWVVLRGIGAEGLVLRPEIKLSNGRLFRPAMHELIVGRSAQAQFEGLEVGNQIALLDGDWTISGTFESNGDLYESEMLTDSETLLSALRTNTFKSMVVQLVRPGSFDQFESALTRNPTLAVDVRRETDFRAAESKPLSQFLTMIAYLVGSIMGIGALFGAINTVYSAVDTRSIEIATLRAIGFGPVIVVTSVLAEPLLLSLLGSAIGCIIACAAFSGNAHAAGSLVFTLTITPSLVILGVTFACLLGLVGGLFPAIRIATLPVADALRCT